MVGYSEKQRERGKGRGGGGEGRERKRRRVRANTAAVNEVDAEGMELELFIYNGGVFCLE